MPKVTGLILAIFLFVFFATTPKTYALGLNTTPSCNSSGIIITLDAPDNSLTNQPNIQVGNGRPIGVNIKIPDTSVQNDWQYYVVVLSHPDLGTERASSFGNSIQGRSPTSTENINGSAYRVYHWDFSNGPSKPAFTSEFNEYLVELKHAEAGPLGINTSGADICVGPDKQLKTINNALAQVASCPLTISGKFNSSDPVTGTVTLKNVPGIYYGYRLDEGDHSGEIRKAQNPLSPIILAQMVGYNPALGGANGTLGAQMSLLSPGTITLPPRSGLNNGKYTLTIYAVNGDRGSGLSLFACGSSVIEVYNGPTTSPTTTGGTVIPSGGAGGTLIDCKTDPTSCTSSAGTNCKTGPGLETAIGCIPTDLKDLIPAILKLTTGVAGGIALLLMIMGAFQMITSAGNPDSLKAGQGRFTSAIIGLLFIIFSVLLLQIIGVDILNLPGFGR